MVPPGSYNLLLYSRLRKKYMPCVHFMQYIKNELNDDVASKIYKVQQATGMTTIKVIGNIVEKWVEDWDEDDEWKTSY